MKKREVSLVNLKNGYVFGKDKIYVQSMLNKPPEDINGNVQQAKELENSGCDIVRVAIPNMDAIKLIPAIKDNISIPLVADIHFDYKLAIESVNAGVDKIRINPGNIGDEYKIKQVISACKKASIPIRIGVNSGSLEKDILEKYSLPTPKALVESALNNVKLLEKYDFKDIIISIKSSDVIDTINAYRLLAGECKYPLHLGVTEAGTKHMGIIKSAIGIGSLLADGIGDTIRVSLTGDPVDEVKAGHDILKAINLDGNSVKIVSCPTCGRTKIDILTIANKIEKEVMDIKKNIKVAIMGCAVNGPGEAKDADIGIAGGDRCGLLFKKGKICEKIPESEILKVLINEIKKM
ncbi:MAG: flavodoxin-dependent (E)-4-hydroxy-3-methylbut-2-enyl-diphosphate synthase [Oscillospiraceae bacterium]|nr:flavodoxin-dependent (E)-4-hydroxy-3-methylbut-2-enyl-diphosphate synthase [Oscillospiraceae bacterium]